MTQATHYHCKLDIREQGAVLCYLSSHLLMHPHMGCFRGEDHQCHCAVCAWEQGHQDCTCLDVIRRPGDLIPSTQTSIAFCLFGGQYPVTGALHYRQCNQARASAMLSGFTGLTFLPPCCHAHAMNRRTASTPFTQPSSCTYDIGLENFARMVKLLCPASMTR